MAGNYWIKFYVEILDDPKMATLPDRLWRRFYELCLIAGRLNEDGNLPDTKQIAWTLRMNESELLPDMEELAKIDLIEKTVDGWNVTNFVKRQKRMTNEERVARFRKEKRNDEYYGNGSVTQVKRNVTRDCNEDVTQVKRNVTDDVTEMKRGVTNDVTQMKRNVTQITDNREQITEAETEVETEVETEAQKPRENPTAAPIPVVVNSFQTGDPFYTRVWSRVTGMMAIPGGEVGKVLNALDGLREMYPNEDELVVYLQKYFDDWKKRKRKDGRPYSMSNCAWIYDLAVAGEPVQADIDKVHLPRADPDCPICDGTGWMRSEITDIHDPKFGKAIQCSCVR